MGSGARLKLTGHDSPKHVGMFLPFQWPLSGCRRAPGYPGLLMIGVNLWYVILHVKARLSHVVSAAISAIRALELHRYRH